MNTSAKNLPVGVYNNLLVNRKGDSIFFELAGTNYVTQVPKSGKFLPQWQSTINMEVVHTAKSGRIIIEGIPTDDECESIELHELVGTEWQRNTTGAVITISNIIVSNGTSIVMYADNTKAVAYPDFIANFTLCAPKWYESIPEQGVLCINPDGIVYHITSFDVVIGLLVCAGSKGKFTKQVSEMTPVTIDDISTLIIP